MSRNPSLQDPKLKFENYSSFYVLFIIKGSILKFNWSWVKRGELQWFSDKRVEVDFFADGFILKFCVLGV